MATQRLRVLLLLTAIALWAAAATATDTEFGGCLQAIKGNTAVLPDDATYEGDSRAFNNRFSAKPAAVFYAYDAAGVSAAVKCAAAAGVKVSPSSGRQSFQGWTVMDDYLLVDTSNMTKAAFSSDNKTVTLGPGNHGSMVQTLVHDSGIPGAAVPSGYCSYVGIAGWMLGGGLGLFGRYLGLGCDSVVGLEVVLANGDIVRADAETNPDLFWASCGAGGGTWGIVTELEVKISTLPNEGRITELTVSYPPGNASVQAFTDFQEALPTLDNRFGLVYSLGGGITGFQLTFSGMFLGSPEEAVSLLEEAGLLKNLSESDAQPVNATASFYVAPHNSSWELFKLLVPAWSGDGFDQPVPWAGMLFTETPENEKWVLSAMHGQAPAGHVVGGEGYNSWLGSDSRLVGIMSSEAVQAVADYINAMGLQCYLATISGEQKLENLACLFTVAGHVLGGEYNARPANATGFGHRDKYFVVDATLSLPMELVKLSPSVPEYSMQLLKGFIGNLTTHLVEPDAAYVNYLVDELPDWQAGYFGGNYPRLQEVKTKYDPTGLFDKPYTVQRLSAEAPAEAPSSGGALHTFAPLILLTLLSALVLFS